MIGKIASLRHCHQVLAYGYELVGEQLTLHVYDSNDPCADDSTIELRLPKAGGPITITTPRITARISGHGTFRALFRHRHYVAVEPPRGLSPGPSTH